MRNFTMSLGISLLVLAGFSTDNGLSNTQEDQCATLLETTKGVTFLEDQWH